MDWSLDSITDLSNPTEFCLTSCAPLSNSGSVVAAELPLRASTPQSQALEEGKRTEESRGGTGVTAKASGSMAQGGLSVAGTGPPAKDISLVRLFFSCMVAGGIQYGWALQLSLLTPYVQTLGISHTLSSLMWLCGPVAGFVVQPLVGLWSDRCLSRFGRRRPFILVGCILICSAVSVIGFSSDIGYALGDTKEHCSIYQGPRWAAAIVFVVGFWVLDFSNNTAQGPARALMADLSGKHGPNTANAIFCSWMALGNILGYSSGASGSWHKWFPFLETKACCEACANLKGAFLIAVVFLILCMSVTMICAPEVQLTKEYFDKDEEREGFFIVFKAFKSLPKGMPQVLTITAITWLSWFPFILYDTDWMGREIHHGDPKGNSAQVAAFDRGVRDGAFGLLLNSIVLAFGSFIVEPLCRKFTAKVVWAMSNFMVFGAMVSMTALSLVSMKDVNMVGAREDIRIGALAIFAILGLPLAVLFSVPFAYAAQLAISGGGGQGLCTGVLNISIVVPQVIIAMGAGPWDAIFGKGNIPAFALAGGFAFICGFLGLFLLPKVSKRDYKGGMSSGH